jgi:hypothetical protein
MMIYRRKKQSAVVDGAKGEGEWELSKGGSLSHYSGREVLALAVLPSVTLRAGIEGTSGIMGMTVRHQVPAVPPTTRAGSLNNGRRVL